MNELSGAARASQSIWSFTTFLVLYKMRLSNIFCAFHCRSSISSVLVRRQLEKLSHAQRQFVHYLRWKVVILLHVAKVTVTRLQGNLHCYLQESLVGECRALVITVSQWAIEHVPRYLFNEQTWRSILHESREGRSRSSSLTKELIDCLKSRKKE